MNNSNSDRENKIGRRSRSLDLLVLALDLLPSDGVALDVLVLGAHDRLAELAEPTLSPHGKQRRVKVRVVLSQVLLLARPGPTPQSQSFTSGRFE